MSIPETTHTWPLSTAQALQVTRNGLGMVGVPLHARNIPLLGPEAWAALDVRLGGLSGRPSLAEDGELLLWARGLAAHSHDPQALETSRGRLLMKALACGTRTNAFVALSDIGEQLGLDRVHAPAQADYPAWLDHRFKMARLYKRRGRFRQAIEINVELASTIPTQKGSAWRAMAESKILLHIAKAAYSHDLRIGLALILSRLATDRLRRLLLQRQNARRGKASQESEVALARDLARAIDTQMGIEFDLLSANAGAAQKIESVRQRSILERWREAEDLAYASGDSSTRTAFRRCRALFDCSSDEPERQSCRVQFRSLLSQLPSLPADVRGQAIRQGHYADMLLQLGLLDDADAYLRSSIEHARSVCDWQTLSINLVRKARLKSRQAERGSHVLCEALDLVNDAKVVLANLDEQPAALHLGHCREQAHLYQLQGEWDKAREALEEADVYLRRTLDRLKSESATVTLYEAPGERGRLNQRSYAPTAILSPVERGQVAQSLAADWSIVSAKQQDLLRELSAASTFGQRSDSQKMSWRRLARYGHSIVHKVKNNYADALVPLQSRLEAHPQCPAVLHGVIREAIEESKGMLGKALITELKLDPAEHQAEVRYHSVYQLVCLSEGVVNDLRRLAPGMVYDQQVVSDFRIEGFEPEIRIQLFSMFENAARVMGQAGDALLRKRLRSRVSWHAVPNDAGSVVRKAFGWLEIEDSAGRLAELDAAVQAVLAGVPSDRWHGLHLAISFLREMYDCTITTYAGEDRSSVLRIQFPNSVRVQP